MKKEITENVSGDETIRRPYKAPTLQSSDAFERLALSSGCGTPEEEVGVGDCTELP